MARLTLLLTVVLALAGAAPSAVQDGPDPSKPTIAPGGAVKADPFAQLMAHPIVDGLSWARFAQYEPVHVALQRVGDGNAETQQQLGWSLGAWAREVVKDFHRDYADPSGATARAGRERVGIAVFSQEQPFVALRQWAKVRDVHDGLAFYAPALGAVVVLDRAAATGGVEDLTLRPVLHAVVHALLDSHQGPGPALPAWMVEGLAERFASHSDALADGYQCVQLPDAESLLQLAHACVDRLERIATLRPLAELVAITTLADLDARTAGLDVPADMPLAGLARESSLFLRWLDEGDPKRAGRGTKLVKAWLAAKAGVAPPALPAPAAELEKEFVGWVQDLLGEFEEVPGSMFSLVPEKVAPGEVRPGVLVGSSDLVLPAGAVELERARGLVTASRGDLAGAADVCAELLVREDLTAAQKAALAADQRLLLALQDLRGRWLASHVGKQVELRDGEQVLRTNLLRLDGAELVVKDKGKERKLPASALLPSVLAAQLITPGNAQKGVDDEARSLAWLLAADPEWKDKTATRARKDAGPAGAALLDKRADYDAALLLGRLAATMEDLAELDLPLAGSTEAERDAWLAMARALFAARSSPLVADRLPVLRALAGRVLAASFDASPLARVALHGKVEPLEAGRVRVTWDGSDAAQLLDWTSRPVPANEFEMFGKLTSAPAPALTIADGSFVLLGTGGWRCAVPFSAPLSIEYDFAYGLTPAEQAARDAGGEQPDTPTKEHVELRVCADDFGSALISSDLGTLVAFDKIRASKDVSNSRIERFYLATTYHMRVEHDGQRVRALVDGREVAAVVARGLLRGALELWHHTDRPIQVHGVTIEGAVDLKAMSAQRDAWVAAQLDTLGA